MKRTVVNRENRSSATVKRSQKRRNGAKISGWLYACACVLAVTLALDFGLFWGMRTGVAEDGVKNPPVQAENAPQEQPQSAKPAPVLLDEAPVDGLCIGVLPTEAGGRMQYYVPEEDAQKTLYERISGMNVDKIQAAEIIPEWCRDAWDYNIVVKYGEYELQLKEGGVMLITRWGKDLSFDKWVARDAEVGEYILGIVKDDIGLTPFDSASIGNIVKAELTTGPLYTGVPKESIVLTDGEKLAKIETLFSRAGKTFWSKCPFGNCRMVLTTAEGEEISLALACDSCTVFYANGCFYDYMPEEYRHADEHPDNTIVFELFGITPEYFLNA